MRVIASALPLWDRRRIMPDYQSMLGAEDRGDMAETQSGRDTVHGSLGSDVDRSAVGKGIQQVNLQVGDRALNDLMDLLRRLQTAVYGDMEAGMAGLVRRLELIQEEVKAMAAQMKALQGKVGILEEQLAQRRETSRAMLILLYVITGLLVVLLGVNLWPILL